MADFALLSDDEDGLEGEVPPEAAAAGDDLSGGLTLATALVATGPCCCSCTFVLVGFDTGFGFNCDLFDCDCGKEDAMEVVSKCRSLIRLLAGGWPVVSLRGVVFVESIVVVAVHDGSDTLGDGGVHRPTKEELPVLDGTLHTSFSPPTEHTVCSCCCGRGGDNNGVFVIVVVVLLLAACFSHQRFLRGDARRACVGEDGEDVVVVVCITIWNGWGSDSLLLLDMFLISSSAIVVVAAVVVACLGSSDLDDDHDHSLAGSLL
jgi:hypothetical protein